MSRDFGITSAHLGNIVGDWGVHNTEAPLCKCISVKSQTPNSTIKEATLLGYRSGLVRLNISLRDDIKPEDFLELKSTYFYITDLDSNDTGIITRSVMTSNVNQFKRAVTILTKDNTLEDDFFKSLLLDYQETTHLTPSDMEELNSFNFTPRHWSPWSSGWSA